MSNDNRNNQPNDRQKKGDDMDKTGRTTQQPGQGRPDDRTKGQTKDSNHS